jgi:bifunctional non-homologous end joining protein LigD
MLPMLARSAFIPPCFPRLRSRPPEGKDWLHEVKFAGRRVQLHKVGTETRIYGHNGADLTAGTRPISDALGRIPTNALILDGELLAGEADHPPQRTYLHAPTEAGEVVVYCFDLLALNGKDLRRLPLLARKEKLAELLAATATDTLRYSDLFTDPKRLLAACQRDGLEGIISKHADAPYRSGRGNWIHVKCSPPSPT